MDTGKRKIKIFATWDEMRPGFWRWAIGVLIIAMSNAFLRWKDGASKDEIAWAAISVMIVAYLLFSIISIIRSKRKAEKQSCEFKPLSPHLEIKDVSCDMKSTNHVHCHPTGI